MQGIIDQMKAVIDADRQTIADLEAIVNSEKDAQGVLKNEVAGLTTKLHAQEENLRKMDAEVARLGEVGEQANSELQQAQDLCLRLQQLLKCECCVIPSIVAV